MNSKKRYVILLVILLVFIWGHSVISKNDSAGESGRMLRAMQRLLDIMHIPLTLTDHFIRKAAHFAEHAAAGFLLGYHYCPKFLNEKDMLTKKVMFALPLLLGFFIGFIDETIQIFSGRSAMVQDVWLDFGGICLGNAAAYCLMLAVGHRGEIPDSDA